MSDTTPAATPETKKHQMRFVVLDDGTIQAQFGEGIDPVSLDPADVPEKVQLAAITEGLIARARAILGRLDGENRTRENLATATAEAFAAFRSGEWKTERVSTATATYTIEEEAAHEYRLLKAQSKGEVLSATLAETAEFWASLTEDQQKQVKATARFAQARAIVNARRAEAKIAKAAKKAAKQDDDDLF